MTDRPNILLITTDQQRFDTIHALGAAHMYTPHLDWLCDEGIAFTRAYSDCPVCVPARATIMTGKHAYTNGCVSNARSLRPLAEHATLPALLAAQGYQTRAQGRMHFLPAGERYGFEEMELPGAYEDACLADPTIGTARYTGQGANEVVPGIGELPPSKTLTRWVVERSMAFLENRDTSRPFFLWSGFADPHPPFEPCRNYWELYRDRTVPEPVHGPWSQRVEDIPNGFLQPTWAMSDYTRMDAEQIAASRRAYYASVTQVDYALGLLFGALRQHGLLENTWIIFTTDHGEMLGDHHMGCKLTFFEGSAHIPMLVRPPAPGWPVPDEWGTRCDRLVTLADITPTCLAIAGVDVPEDMDGRDMRAVAAAPDAADPVFIGDCQHKIFAVMDGPWKYQWAAEGGAELLFDLDDDPEERRNLAGVAAHAGKLDELRRQLVDHLEKRGSKRVGGGKLQAVAAPASSREVQRYPAFRTPPLAGKERP